MKLFSKISKLTLICALGLLVLTCQKEESDFTINDSSSELTPLKLKSASPSDYLQGLIEIIEGLVVDGTLNEGNAKALIVKIKNAIKSLEKGNENALNGQLNALINQVQGFINNGIILPDIGNKIINYAEGGIVLSNGSFIDSRDGHKYKVVSIGNQIWMAENLAYLPSVSPSGHLYLDYYNPVYYVYGYEGTSVSAAKATTNYTKYGVLYNLPAAKTACPNGWHLPSDDEWKQMEMAIGMSQIEADGIAERGTDEGTKLKATSGWYNNGNGTDDCGFAALPGGVLSEHFAEFTHLGERGFWWSSTEIPSSDASVYWWRILHYNTPTVFRSSHYPQNGVSVRCVRD